MIERKNFVKKNSSSKAEKGGITFVDYDYETSWMFDDILLRDQGSIKPVPNKQQRELNLSDKQKTSSGEKQTWSLASSGYTQCYFTTDDRCLLLARGLLVRKTSGKGLLAAPFLFT